MKAAVFAAIILIAVIILVLINSMLVSFYIGEIIDKLEKAPDNTESNDIYRSIFEDYMKRQKFIGLTVSHDDLTNIENEFNEILGAIEADEKETLIIAKSRLIGALKHLKRLSGINADSIF